MSQMESEMISKLVELETQLVEQTKQKQELENAHNQVRISYLFFQF